MVDFNPQPWANGIDALSQGIQQGMNMGFAVKKQRQLEDEIEQKKLASALEILKMKEIPPATKTKIAHGISPIAQKHFGFSFDGGEFEDGDVGTINQLSALYKAKNEKKIDESTFRTSLADLTTQLRDEKRASQALDAAKFSLGEKQDPLLDSKKALYDARRRNLEAQSAANRARAERMASSGKSLEELNSLAMKSANARIRNEFPFGAIDPQEYQLRSQEIYNEELDKLFAPRPESTRPGAPAPTPAPAAQPAGSSARERFIQGAIQKGYTRQEAEEIATRQGL